MQSNSSELVGQVVLDRLSQVVVGEGTHHRCLTVFPLFAPKGEGDEGQPFDYRTMDEAIAEGWVEVTEKDSATVPELVLINKGRSMVLIVDGEEIVGGRQNRIVNATFLVATGAEVTLPVSCVEHGRWHDVSDHFQPGEVSYFSLKREKFEQVRSNLRQSGRPMADQSAIWSHLSDRHSAEHSRSDTEAMNDLYRTHEHALAEYEEAFPYPAGAIGLAVALNGPLAGAELFDQPRTARVLWRKLVRSYALDALDGKAKEPVAQARAASFLSRLRNARCEVYPSLALGQDVRLQGDGAVGMALVHDRRAVHVSLFRRYSGATEGGMASTSAHRRYHRQTLT